MNTATQPKPTLRSVANSIFVSSLPSLAKLGDRAWRKMVREEIISQLKVKGNNASTLYNYAKVEAVRAGLVPDFSRSARMEARRLAAIEAAKPKPQVGDKWQLINKVTREPLGYFPTRKLADMEKHEGALVERIPQ